MKLRFYILFLVSLLSFILCAGCGSSAVKQEAVAVENKGEATANLVVKVLDIGQGDAILVKSPTANILIDTGDDKIYEDGKKGVENNLLFTRLKEEGIDHIDKLILTHAHADHIGKAAEVIRDYQVKEIIYNGIPSKSKYFLAALKEAKNQGTKQVKVKAGDVVDFGDGASFRVINPSTERINQDKEEIQAGKKVEVNNESVTGILSYGEFSMMLTGDSEAEVEKELLAKYGRELNCQVLKAGHHGSKTSSSEAFLKGVAPEAVIISVGKNNQYKHPHEAILKRLKGLGFEGLWRTDVNGTITITTDGKSYNISSQK